MAVTVRQETDLDVLEAAARDNVQRLVDARARLALDGLGGDPEVRTELEAVESEMAGANGELERIDLARAERARRELEAEKDARQEAQQAAHEEARRIQVDRERAARGFDSAAVKLACALADYERCCTRQVAALTRAGMRHDLRSAASLRSGRVEAALKHALREQHVENALDLPPVRPQHVKPLRETDPRIVEPLKEDDS